MAQSYRNNFKKSTSEDWFMKNTFEVFPFCSSKYASNNTNMLSRIKSSVARAITSCIKLAKYIIVILDDDLIRYLDYYEGGLAGIYGEWLEWLMEQMNILFKERREILPPKAVNYGYPQVYWVGPPHHKLFFDNRERKCMGNCIESVCKLYDNFRLIRMKEIWSYDDTTLVDQHGHMTSTGLACYWRSVDAAVRFNARKREISLAKSTISTLSLKTNSKKESKNASESGDQPSSSTKQRFVSDIYQQYRMKQKQCESTQRRCLPKPTIRDIPLAH